MGLDLGAVKLGQSFDPDVTDYTAETRNNRNTITATPEDKNADVSIVLNGETPVQNGEPVVWENDVNELTITVNNDGESKSYNVTVVKT